MNCKNCEYGLKQSCGDFEKIICTYEEGECVKITELEQQKNWLEGCKSELSEHLGKANDRIVELEKKNTALRQDWEIMKNTIADYNDFCDKYIKLEKELEEEKKLNAEIKARFVKCNTCTDEMKSKCLMFTENLCEGERCEELIDIVSLVNKSDLEREREEVKTIIQDLLNNSDEYARQRAIDFLKERK